MTIEAIPQKDNSSFIARTWLWLCALDDAVHYDPVEKLQHRIDRLERRFAEIDGNSQPKKEQEQCERRADFVLSATSSSI